MKKPVTPNVYLKKKKSDLYKKAKRVEEKEIYFAERIDGKRKLGDVTQYFVKWKGWPASSNTWEPLEHLTECTEMIEEYESRVAESKKSDKINESEKHNGSKKIKSPLEVEKSSKVGSSAEDQEAPKCPDYLAAKDCGFNNKWIPEKIIGATDTDGELKFLIKFQGLNREYLVPSKTLRKLDPQMLIRYYEKHTKWMEE